MNRPYQQKALNNSVTRWDAGVYRQLHVMATGTGKTHCFAQLPKTFKGRLDGQMLVIAHREELIDQAILKIQVENPGIRVDKEKAEHVADPSLADIVVASVASMSEKRMLKYHWENFDKFVIDEAHHSTADSYTRVLERACITKKYSDKYRRLLTGWTATPQRGDGEALARVYQEIVTVYTIREAIEDGWLVDVRGYRIHTDTSLDGVKTTAGDFNQGQLADTVNNPERNAKIYKAWIELAEDRQTIGFCVDIQHAKDLAKLFSQRDVKAEAIWGNDPDRAKKLAMFREGYVEVLFNCDILTEGFDMWEVAVVLNCAPTKSPVKYIQRAGRTTRLQEGTGNLKEYVSEQLKSGHLEALFGPDADIGIKRDSIVIDIVDKYTTRNSLVTLPTLMGLPNTMDLKGKSMTWAIQQIEDAQKEFPHIDLSALPDISQLNSYIQSVNLLDPVFPEETSESEMSWHRTPTGGLALLLPERDYIKIEQNLLDVYELKGCIKGKNYKGERGSLHEAIRAADSVVQKVLPNSWHVVKKEQAWHKEPATDAQLKTLKRFFKGKQIPLTDMTKGKASRLISSHIAGKG